MAHVRKPRSSQNSLFNIAKAGEGSFTGRMGNRAMLAGSSILDALEFVSGTKKGTGIGSGGRGRPDEGISRNLRRGMVEGRSSRMDTNKKARRGKPRK
jgi:hypothetical protein